MHFIILFIFGSTFAQDLCECSEFTTNSYCISYEQCLWNGKSCYQPQCQNINDQSKCYAPLCNWYLEQCHNGQTCNYYTKKEICNQVFGCVFNDGYCLPYEDCNFTSQKDCNGITQSGIQCFWNSNSQSCIEYQSCNRLSLENNDCGSVPYCIQKKKKCLNFNQLTCSDMTTESDCNRMQSYQCIWYQNECISYLCTNYQTQASCILNSCTWTGQACQYCPDPKNYMNGQYIKILYLMLILILI